MASTEKNIVTRLNIMRGVAQAIRKWPTDILAMGR
jgi:hypothetical protein